MALTAVTHIPAIMRAQGWSQGAELMERWFRGPLSYKPYFFPAPPDLTTIKMDWVLRFSRARDAYDDMVENTVWSNDKAKPVVFERMADQRLIRPFTNPPVALPFDWSRKSVQDQHKLHVNYSVVDSPMLSLDSLTAALGNFSIYVTPLVGYLMPQVFGTLVRLHKVGFHVMDSYDFDGYQFLGRWNEDTNSVSSVPTAFENDINEGKDGLGTTHGEVNNADFRNWRAANKKGGDFLIYSDVQELVLNPPLEFQI
jgi:Family of unknown function (DUF6402)